MSSNHLFCSIRMIYNNSVPPAFRVGHFIRKTLPSWMTAEYIHAAMLELLCELQERPDYFLNYKFDIEDMIANLDVLAKVESQRQYLAIAI